MATFKEVKAGARVGSEAMLPTHKGSLSFAVVVVDYKESYGTARYLVEPITGSGDVWVNADSLTFLDTETL
jgi:hypothetical protein